MWSHDVTKQRMLALPASPDPADHEGRTGRRIPAARGVGHSLPAFKENWTLSAVVARYPTIISFLLTMIDPPVNGRGQPRPSPERHRIFVGDRGVTAAYHAQLIILSNVARCIKSAKIGHTRLSAATIVYSTHHRELGRVMMMDATLQLTVRLFVRTESSVALSHHYRPFLALPMIAAPFSTSVGRAGRAPPIEGIQLGWPLCLWNPL